MMELFNAIKQGGSYEDIQGLVISSTNMNHRNPEGITLVEIAVLRGDPNIVKLLFDHGANIRVTNSTRIKSLPDTFFDSVCYSRAGSQNQLHLLEVLLEQGLDLSEASDHPSIPPRVLRNMTLDLFLKLLSEKMVVHDVTGCNYPFPLVSALDNSDDRIWQYILDHKLVDLDEKDCADQTILMVVASCPGKGVEILVRAGADPDALCAHHIRTPLVFSMYRSRVTKNFKFLFLVSNDSSITLAYRNALALNLTAYIEFMVTSLAKWNYLNPLPIVSHLRTTFGDQFNILFQECSHELEITLSEIVTDNITLRDILFTEDLRIYFRHHVLCQSVTHAVQKAPLVHYQLELDKKSKIMNSMLKVWEGSNITLSRLLQHQNLLLPSIICRKIADHLNEVDLVNLCRI